MSNRPLNKDLKSNRAYRQRLKYVVGDYVMSNVAWLVFNCLRYKLGFVAGYGSLWHFLSGRVVVAGQIFFPLMMMAVYVLSGYYNEVCRKSRLQELMTTAGSAVVNTLLIFFLALINDVIGVRGMDYKLVLLLWAVLFGCVYALRCITTNVASHKIKTRQWTFPTLVVGSGASAVAFADQLDRMHDSMGYDVRGFVSIPGENDAKEARLPRYRLDDIEQVCQQEGIEELIVVPTRQESHQVMEAVNQLFKLGLPIKVVPDRFNLLKSQVRITDMYGVTLVDISGSSMSECGKNIKRLIDIVVSALALVVLLPFFALIALIIKNDSKGPVLYKQERIGYHNKAFKIIKFRSMKVDAEQGGVPQLTSDGDPRITGFGRFMRKYRIDELPQFWNVLKGDMSLVGPRPERRYYIDLISQRVPAYALLHQVRPGITSLGMVKYGYAKNVDEMVERLSYDLMYLENMSLLNDMKIMAYTVKIVFTGRGM